MMNRALAFACLLSALIATAARGEIVSREQDIVDLRLGQKVMVDDGSCGPGEIKEVMGATMTASGVARTRKCVPRLGPRQK